MDPPGPFHPTATRRVRPGPKVGVGVLVVVDDDQHVGGSDASSSSQQPKIYAGIRKSSHGSGRLALPGGHLEMYESWEDCAKREVLEEMNLQLDLHQIQFAHVTNDVMFDEEKHYVTIFMMARVSSTVIPENMEPHKCEGWETYTWSQLRTIATREPDKLFVPLLKLLKDQPPAAMDFLNLRKQRD